MRLDIWNDPPLQNHSTRYDMFIMEILREIFWLKREHFTDLISDLCPKEMLNLQSEQAAKYDTLPYSMK